ncbi:MAG: hypothetical protein RSC80_01015 [Odoribacter sp.]
MENKNEIFKKIKSGEPEMVAEAIREIKENGDLNIAEELIDSLADTSDRNTITAIVDLLADIKESAFKEVLIRKLKEASSSELKSLLIRISWESSLDYSTDLDVFVDFLLQNNFAIAFEASTAIEEMVHHLTKEQRNALSQTLSSPTLSEDKKFLVENILEELSIPEEEPTE